ncbi:hypothetical protein [Reinekea sp.]|jgi:hypothetical protein|uniref:hypothetical protein n=1 Tax=Reinekea sp. TaxID=1970455 RepID=UPI00398933A2
MVRTQRSSLKYLIIFMSCLILGVLTANTLVTNLDVSIHSDREFFNLEIQQALKPNTEKNLAIQEAIYAQRVSYLESKTKTLALKKKAIEDYLAPLETQINEYRYAFAEKTQQSFDDRLELYIELVRKHSQYNSAQKNANYVPLANSESLFTFPSIHNDFIRQVGGELARAHNDFIAQPRDASIAALYEPTLRLFLTQHKIQQFTLECHRETCAVHLSHQWQDPYYDGMAALKDEVSQQPWFDLIDDQSAHEYRGNGRHIGVWYFKVNR